MLKVFEIAEESFQLVDGRGKEVGWIRGSALGFSGLQPGELDLYYEDCVIGGPGAFIVSVADPAQLGEAIRRKLVLEVAGPSPRPIPASLIAQGPRIDCLIGEKTRPSWLDENAK